MDRPPPGTPAEVALVAAPSTAVAEVLLQWVFDRVGGISTKSVYIIDFHPCLDPPKVDAARSRLIERGYIQFSSALSTEMHRLEMQNYLTWKQLWDSGERNHISSMNSIDRTYGNSYNYRTPTPYPFPPPIFDPILASMEVRLTVKGCAEAEHSRERWNDRLFRNRAARDHLLAWLYDQDGLQVPASSGEFLAHPESIIDGNFLSERDVEAALAYLVRHALVKPSVLGLTSHGIDCMEQGGSVADYLDPHRDQGKYVINNPTASGNFIIGEHNITISGSMVSLLDLMSEITQELPTLRISTKDHKTAEDAASQIITQAKAQLPDQGKLRTAFRILRDVLSKAGNEALVHAVDYELVKLGLPLTG